MIVVGALLKGNTVRLVTLSGTRPQHARISEKIHKLELPSKPLQEDVEMFVQTFEAFCSDNAVGLICINQRATSGKHAGGAATFRIEGIILAVCTISIRFIHTATMCATERRQAELKTSRPNSNDLGRAYDLAFEGLE